jgi:Activator of Hsp90 ATPase homolog 1-like protein
MTTRTTPGDALVAPLVKEVRVPCSPDQAFELFTARMSDWWPMDTHSVGGQHAVAVHLEGRVGGHIIESMDDGRSTTWGTITDWQPPTRFVMTWHPGQPTEQATYVEVTFRPDDSSTIVTLTHSGWSNRMDAAEARRRYDAGWNLVLDRFVRGIVSV